MNRPRKKEAPAQAPHITTASGRRLPCFPAAVLAILVDDWGKVLLFRRPGREGWEVISGGLEPGESVPEAMQREIGKKMGEAVLAVYLGIVDTFTFVFDAQLPPLINICCLLRYRGGIIYPASDAKGAEFRWWDLSDLDSIELTVPRARWDLLVRAVELAQVFRKEVEEREEPLF